MSYLALKGAHAGFAYLTLLSFTIRGIWMLTDSRLLTARLTRIVPHVIDTA